MKTEERPQSRFSRRRDAVLRQMGKIGPFVEGSLVGVKHPTCNHVGWRLTFKVKAKTKTLYVPVDMAEEVAQWAKQYKELKEMMKTVSRNSMAIIRSHVGARRAANRGRRLGSTTSGAASKRSRNTVSPK